MTIKELYEWAKNNEVEDCDLVVRGFTGSYTYNVLPEVVEYKNYDGEWEKEVEL